MTRKLTTQQFKEKLKKARGDSVILLSKYGGSTNPVTVRFMPCGHKRTINKPYNLLNGSKCPICSRRQKTTEVFKQEVYDLVGNEYTVNSKYNNARTKINIVHNKCGYKDWWIRPSDFLGGLRCPKCSKNAKKTQKKFEEDVKALYGDEYTVTGKYVDSGTPVEIRHNVCGHRWSPTPNNFLAGHSHCTECRKRRLRKLRQLPHEEVLDRIKKLYSNTIQILNIDDYDNSQSILEYHCTVCGHDRKAIAGNLLNGHGCANCANQHRNDGTRLNIQEVTKRIYNLSNGTYEYVSGDYEKNTSDIVVCHLECNQKFHTTWLKFSQGVTPCPNCRGSFGEQQIKGYLQLHKINYSYGYLISGLKAKKELHFDFWIPQYNVAIEYDGQQHFRATDFAGKGKKWAKQQFEKVHEHDLMKDQYCKSKNIRLIRIPYTKKVNDILNKQLLPIVKLSNNKAKIEFKETSSNDLLPLMLNYHYLHRRVATSYSYGLYVSGELMGMVTYTKPRLSLAQSISDKANRENTLELSRLYIMDSVSQRVPNITSKFVGWSLRQLKKRGNWYIISFADSGMHHTGAIYQATNFLYCGTTKPGEYAWNGLGKHGGAWKKGSYYRYMIQSSQKYRYIKFIGSKSFKKHARKELKFEVQIYPKLNSVHYQIGDIEERLIRDRETGRIYKESELAKKLGMLS